MTATAESPPEPQMIPLDMLSKRLERAVNRVQPPDKRPALLRKVQLGPAFRCQPACYGCEDCRRAWDDAELSRKRAVYFVRQVMAQLEPDGHCTAKSPATRPPGASRLAGRAVRTGPSRPRSWT